MNNEIENKEYQIVDLKNYGYRGYTIDTNGEVTSFKGSEPRILKSTRKGGSSKVTLCVPKKPKGTSIDVPILMAKVFIPKYTKNHIVILRDGNNNNNKLSNIMVITKKQEEEVLKEHMRLTVSKYIDYKKTFKTSEGNYDIVDLEPLGLLGYTVESSGEVVSHIRNKPKTLIGTKTDGVKKVTVKPFLSKKSSQVSVGKLVWRAFNGTIKKDQTIVFKDGDWNNVSLKNLSLVTKKSKRTLTQQERIEKYMTEQRKEFSTTESTN